MTIELVAFADWAWWHWLLAALAILAAAYAIRVVASLAFAVGVLGFLGVAFLVAVPFIGWSKAKEWTGDTVNDLAAEGRKRWRKKG